MSVCQQGWIHYGQLRAMIHMELPCLACCKQGGHCLLPRPELLGRHCVEPAHMRHSRYVQGCGNPPKTIRGPLRTWSKTSPFPQHSFWVEEGVHE